jgi:hypothetical protein
LDGCLWRLPGLGRRQFLNARITEPVPTGKEFQAVHLRREERIFDAADLDKAAPVGAAHLRGPQLFTLLLVRQPDVVARLQVLQLAFCTIREHLGIVGQADAVLVAFLVGKQEAVLLHDRLADFALPLLAGRVALLRRHGHAGDHINLPAAQCSAPLVLHDPRLVVDVGGIAEAEIAERLIVGPVGQHNHVLGVAASLRQPGHAADEGQHDGQ